VQWLHQPHVSAPAADLRGVVGKTTLNLNHARKTS
jgi:hypothetical protein